MKTKHLFGVLTLLLCATFFSSCLSNKQLPDRSKKDKTEKLNMYVSAETSTYRPWGPPEPVECMLVKEKKKGEYTKMGLFNIAGFTYEKGYEYKLLVEKTTLANPPADSSIFRYKLIKLLSKTAVDKP